MGTNLTLSIAALALGLGAAACGGTEATSGPTDPVAADTEAKTDVSSAPAGPDELGGPGRWSASQLCALSTADAVSTQFGNIEINEQAGIDEPAWTSCSWKDATDPLALSPMGITQYGDFGAEGLGSDIDIDIAGADAAGYNDSVGGAATLWAVVGDQALEIAFPVGTEGAQEFGTVVASIWVAGQGG